MKVQDNQKPQCVIVQEPAGEAEDIKVLMTFQLQTLASIARPGHYIEHALWNCKGYCISIAHSPISPMLQSADNRSNV